MEADSASLVSGKKSGRDDGVEQRAQSYYKRRENLRESITKVFVMFWVVGSSASCSSVVVWVLKYK